MISKSSKEKSLDLPRTPSCLVGLCTIILLTLTACNGTDLAEIENNAEIVSTELEETPFLETDIPPTLETIEELGKIAFYSSRDGNGEIYLMDADGENQINLTKNDANDSYPSWSPDGSKIAFTSYRDNILDSVGLNVSEIYIMNADGSDPVRLTDNDIRETDLDWSPDGDKIVFYTNWDGIRHEDPYLDWTEMEIGVIDVDGSNMVRLTNNDFRDASPVWSPDGSKIAFWSERDGNGEIYLMDADGNNVTRLTYDDSEDALPAWSPDGRKIAFSSDRNGTAEICIMDTDGSNVTCLQNSEIFKNAIGPDWSLDGNKILFNAKGYTGTYIYVINADGSDLKRLVESIGYNGLSVWQP